MIRTRPLLAAAAASAAIAAALALPPAAASPALASSTIAEAGTIAAFSPRFGRSRPVIAIIGENSGTELTDFVVPYSVLTRSGSAEVVTVATRPGVLRMRPALQIQPEATVADFDQRFPEGADYVIVPAVVNSADPALVGWVAAQRAKGATLVSICDGALVVANSGAMNGRRATAHWATHGLRERKYPETRWLQNVRYVADGPIVSSAGISAALPTSLALVEAISGRAKATALALTLGAPDWSQRHDSEGYRPKFGRNLGAYIATRYTNEWFHRRERVGLPVAAGVDEMALAFTADAYSRTGRSQAFSVAASAAPVTTRHGLLLVPDRIAGQAGGVDRLLPAGDPGRPAMALDAALRGIADSYGRKTAYGVSLLFEYPGYRK